MADDDTTAVMTALVASQAQAQATLSERVLAQILAIVNGFTGESWRDGVKVQKMIAQISNISTAGQRQAASSTDAYLSRVLQHLAVRHGGPRIPPRPSVSPAGPRPTVPPAGARPVFKPTGRVDLAGIRGGKTIPEIFDRVAREYRDLTAAGYTPEDAQDRAVERITDIAEMNQVLAKRAQSRHTMTANKVATYRRVIHPELSKSGTCGLCIAASHRIYKTKDLLPIHDNCHCETLPIIGDNDPGAAMNTIDLDALYKDAGATTAAKLKATRYQIDEHGELGPILVPQGAKRKTAREALAAPSEAEKAATQLVALRKSLAALEARAAAGEDVSKPLEYQRNFIAKLEKLAA